MITTVMTLAAATNWTKFFGHFHPLLVHLPIGFLVLLGALEVAGRFKKFQHITAARGFILVMLSIAAVFTITCGWLLASGGGYGHRVLFWHRWLGTSVGVLSIALLVLWVYQRKASIAYYSTLTSALIVMAIAAHFGGTLTFGSRYLSKYAPPILKPLLGDATKYHAFPTSNGNSAVSAIAGDANNTEINRGATRIHITPIVNLQNEGSFYNRYIQTIFTDNCTRCHGRNRQKAHLRLDSYGWLRHGSRGKPVVIPYNAGRSVLYELISRPLWQRHHMPPRHHHQLTANEIQLIRWWIQSGASDSASLNSLHPPAYIRRIIWAEHPAPRNMNVRVTLPGAPIAMLSAK
jgi:uncharacterized membrane protein